MKARFFAIAAMVLGMVSCAKDFAPESNYGGEVDFTLAVSAPELAVTRAGADGQNDGVNGHNSAYGAIDYLTGTDWDGVNLRYILEVYDVADDYTNATPIKDRQVKIVDKYEPVKFELRLAPKRDYHFVVFADFVAGNVTDVTPTEDAQKNLGAHHVIGATLGDITIKNDKINDECADAYFGTLDYNPSNNNINNNVADQKPLILKRPYSKVRVVATDLAELNLNVEPASVQVVYTASHATAFNAVNGTISSFTSEKLFEGNYNALFKDVEKGGLSNHFYTEDYDSRTAVSKSGVERHTHMTLFTDYILATDEQNTIQFTMTVFDKKLEDPTKQPIKTTAFNTQIPVQRNYLTTIIGNVLTTATEIEVSIDDNFAGYYNPEIIFVGNAEQLQKAIDNYVDGQTILFEADIKGDVVINQYIDKNYYINGNGYKYDGKIEINGNARQNDPDSVTLQNINFETAKTSLDVIDANENKKYGNLYNYAHNITIKDCTFNLGEGSVAMKFRQSKNIVVENCVMTAGHSFMQLYGVNGVVVDNANVESKNGISLGTSTGAKVKNSTIVATGYGLRGEPNGDVAVENSTIDAMLPIVARQLDKETKTYAVSVDANSELVAPGYQVVFTAGSDDTLIVPAGTFSIDRSDLLVFPGEKLFAYNAAQLQYLLDNAVPGETVIEFAADIVGDITVDQAEGENIVLDGRDYKFNGTIFVNGHARMDEAETLLIKNINFETTDAARVFVEQNSTASALRYPHNVTIDNCTFKGAGEDVMVAKIRQGKNIVVKNSVVEVGHSLMQLYGTENVTVDNVTVKAGRGISFGTSTNNVVKNSTFDVTSYGLRTDATLEAVLNIENVNITANLPVVARKASANYTINFTGDNTLNAGGEYQVVFTKGEDDAAFVAPAAFSHTGAYDFKVFPDLNVNVNTLEDFKNAVSKHNAVVNVEGALDTTVTEIPYLSFADANELTLNFADNTLKSGSPAEYAVKAFNKTEVTINDVALTSNGGGVSASNGAKLIFNGDSVYVDSASTSGRYNFYANGAEIVINSGTFSWDKNDNTKRSYVCVEKGGKVIINGGVFGKASTRSGYTGIRVIDAQSEVIVYGGTFGFDPSEWVAEGYQAVYDSATKTWTVQVM